ncbi:MAG: peroxidase-related enzyme [Pseudomonadota bacterium]
MPHLPSLPDDARLLHVFRGQRETAKPLLAYHEALMRGPSPLSVAERELLAAYASGLNQCSYCHGAHRAAAEAFGIAEGTLEDLLGDPESAAVDPKLQPLLRYVKKLTEAPARMTQADADAVYAAGWDEQALHDAVAVCALFNFMNRYVEGLGIQSDETYFDEAGRRLHDVGYRGLLPLLEQD